MSTSPVSSEALAESVQLLRLADKAMMTPPPSEDKAPPSSQKSTSNHSDSDPKQAAGNADNNTYIESLKEERQQLSHHADCLNHVFTLIDKEIKRVTGNEVSKDAVLSEIIAVPVEKYPNYNFVGRILGPRGTTAKQLEASIGCKVTILGRTKKDVSTESLAPTDNGPLRVQISCPADLPDAAQRMEAGISVINALLVPPADGQDELKRQQLMVLANMNGTYRPRSSTSQSQYNTGGAGDFGHQHQFQNLLPYGYRLPVMSKSQHEMPNEFNLLHSHLSSNSISNSHSTKFDCFNPKCTILRNLIEQNSSKNATPKIEDVLNVMHMYELMNRIRLANSSLFGEPRRYDDMVKAQEIGKRMCSALGTPAHRSRLQQAKK
uniref:KH domain-containing protein n=3 Tax=Caenorhabditis japonica TaxID=281687 RepID=K7GVS5_CAEJA